MTLASRSRYWLPLLPLLGLLGMTYWLNLQVVPEPVKLDSGKRHDPDAIMENFSAVKLNEQGIPRFIMAAKKMQNYRDDDSATLELPRLTTLSAGHPTIHTIARRGVVTNRGEEISLYEDVEVLREADGQQGEMTLQTEYLHILPDENTASTDRAVTIVDARSTTHATGLEMDNRTRTLKLLSKVRSEHAPARK